MSGASARLLRRCAIVCALTVTAGYAWAMELIDSSPRVNEVVESKAISFAVRFDQPVNHRISHLTLVTPQGSRALPLRLRTEPDTLYANIEPLTPGNYELQWEAHAADGSVARGSIPFTVEAK